jgi:hypothetical protein
VLEGDQVKVLDHELLNQRGFSDAPPIVKSLLGLETPSEDSDALGTLVQLAISMRKHGRGGSLLIVPERDGEWRDSIVQPVSYSVSPVYSELNEMPHGNQGDSQRRVWQDRMQGAIDAVAGLTAVDGATVLTGHCELLAFGAKITRRQGYPRVEQLVESEPIEGAEDRIYHPTQLGGTRHLSAAQFAQDQPDSVALVASQDGRFTVFAWSRERQMVRAFRVEALLL